MFYRCRCLFSHSRKYFTQIDDPEMSDIVKTSMGLLAFSAETQLEPYKVLLHILQYLFTQTKYPLRRCFVLFLVADGRESVEAVD